jgi:hypothetical protein
MIMLFGIQIFDKMQPNKAVAPDRRGVAFSNSSGFIKGHHI